MNLMEKKKAVSKRIGEMLLMGYKMLAESCHICNNVIMQDRLGNKICAFCEMSQDETSIGIDEASTVIIDNSQDKSFKAGDVSRSEQVGMSEVESVLFEEIELSAGNLRSISRSAAAAAGSLKCQNPAEELSAKNAHVQYIRECAQTILAIRNLKKFN